MKDNGLIVLSLFDGISCGQIALERAKVKVAKYYASEIKDFAIETTMEHYKDTIQIGDVCKVKYKDGILYTENGNFEVGKIDILIGGSPCQNFSNMSAFNKQGVTGLKGEKSKLFYEYLRILKETQPKWFLLENVKMSKENENILNEYLGVKGIHINSSLVSFQNRPRIYWTNIKGIEAPKDKNISFQDHIDTDENNLMEAIMPQTPSRLKMWNNGEKGTFACKNVTKCEKVGTLSRKQDRCPNSGLVAYNGFARFLTRAEIEKAQTLPPGYTKKLSYTKMQDVCGDGWTIDVIAHIFNYLKGEADCVSSMTKEKSNIELYNEQLQIVEEEQRKLEELKRLAEHEKNIGKVFKQESKETYIKITQSNEKGLIGTQIVFNENGKVVIMKNKKVSDDFQEIKKEMYLNVANKYIGEILC